VNKLHESYTRWFVVLNAGLLTGDLLNAPVWARATMLVMFLAVELVGALRFKPMGDTWSQNVWVAIKHKPARWPPALGWSYWFLYQFVEMAPALEPIEQAMPVPETGLLVLLASAFVWLVFHFLLGGRHG